MKLAIILSVSEYQNQSNNLPGCERDLDVIKSILEHARYDDILEVREMLPAQKVKERISNWIRERQEYDIDELFFYYTGHGGYNGSDFIFQLSDYDANREHRTTLRNHELDTWLKMLAPKMMIKVVDACHAGVRYIKSNKAESTEFIKQTRQSFNNCYFMYSSGLNQSSYQDEYMSDFTKHFAMSIAEHDGGDVRFKDIMDYISDKFIDNEDQRPVFVTQANFTEVFCNSNENIKSTIKTIIKNNNTPTDSTLENISALDLIKKDSERFVEKQIAQSILNQVKEAIETFAFNFSDCDDLFSLTKIYSDSTSDLPFKEQVASWIADEDEEVFAKPLLAWRTIKKPRSALEKMAMQSTKKNWLSFLSEEDPDYKTVKIQEPYDFKQTSDMLPFCYARLDATPKFENLTKISLYIVIIISYSGVYTLSQIEEYRRIDWSKYEPSTYTEWIISKRKWGELRSGLDDFISNPLDDYQDYIVDYIADLVQGIVRAKQKDSRLLEYKQTEETKNPSQETV